jgi:hypothetical protein
MWVSSKSSASGVIHSWRLIKDVWLEIQWYYRRVDLEDVGVEWVLYLLFWSLMSIYKCAGRSLATSMGDYELVLSNHKSFVDITCVEGVFPIPGDLLYHSLTAWRIFGFVRPCQYTEVWWRWPEATSNATQHSIPSMEYQDHICPARKCSECPPQCRSTIYCIAPNIWPNTLSIYRTHSERRSAVATHVTVCYIPQAFPNDIAGSVNNGSTTRASTPWVAA